MVTSVIFRYTAAERPYSETMSTFQMVIFVKINLIIQVSSSGRKNVARLPRAV